MYKKVTHTIVEKHYSLPKEAKTKQKFNPYYEGVYEGIRPKASLTTVDKFKNDVNAYFTQLHQRLTNISNATESGNMDLLLAEETSYFDEVENLGKLLESYYGLEFKERMNQSFRGLGLSMIGLGRSLKFKNDIKLAVDRIDENLGGLDLLLNQFNNSWPAGVVKTTWLKIRESLINETSAIMNKDSVATATAHSEVSGELLEFANSLSNSIIQQYPNRFIQ